MKIIIEKIENDIVTVELPSGKIINAPRELFDEIKENDVVSITVDKEETDKKVQEIKSLMDDIFED